MLVRKTNFDGQCAGAGGAELSRWFNGLLTGGTRTFTAPLRFGTVHGMSEPDFAIRPAQDDDGVATTVGVRLNVVS